MIPDMITTLESWKWQKCEPFKGKREQWSYILIHFVWVKMKHNLIATKTSTWTSNFSASPQLFWCAEAWMTSLNDHLKSFITSTFLCTFSTLLSSLSCWGTLSLIVKTMSCSSLPASLSNLLKPNCFNPTSCFKGIGISNLFEIFPVLLLTTDAPSLMAKSTICCNTSYAEFRSPSLEKDQINFLVQRMLGLYFLIYSFHIFWTEDRFFWKTANWEKEWR